MGLSPKTTNARYQHLKAYFAGMETPDNGDEEMEVAASKRRAKVVKKGGAKQAKKVVGDDQDADEITHLQTNPKVKKDVKKEDEDVKVKLEDSEEDLYEA